LEFAQYQSKHGGNNVRIISKLKVQISVERWRLIGYPLANAVQKAANELGIDEEAVNEALKTEDELNELEAA
jgi:hypothetical protein